MSDQAGADIYALVADVYRRLEAEGDPKRRKVAESYTPTRLRVLGVAVPHIRAVVRDVSGRLKGGPPGVTLALAAALVSGGTLEGRQAGYEILSRHRAAMAALRTGDVERLGRGIDNWVSVDIFACLISGPAWRRGQVTDATVIGWTRSEDRWWRRAVIVGTVALNQKSKGGAGDTPRTLLICEAVVADRDDMVAKGLSWALRELLARDRRAVVDFLDRLDETIAPPVRREVRNKLKSGLKNPRRG